LSHPADDDEDQDDDDDDDDEDVKHISSIVKPPAQCKSSVAAPGNR